MQNLNCNQVSALLPFFIEGKLSENLMLSVEYHLNVCKTCKEKFIEIKNIYCNTTYNNPAETLEANNNNVVSQFNFDNFKNNLSAYLDNELNDKDNLRIKKMTISNPTARQELENLIMVRKLLYDVFDKTRNDMKEDFSIKAINKLYGGYQDINSEYYNPYLILACGFISTILLVLVILLFT